MAKESRNPRCIIIGGPNGAGKTTFARDFLPGIAGFVNFINADLIASGISPLQPELAAVSAGRIVLHELERLVEARQEFAFESTLSGLGHAKRIQAWRATGYFIEIVFLKIASPRLALRRVAARARHGGHDVPARDVIRRWKRGWPNFQNIYRPLADHWVLYDNSGSKPEMLEHGS